MIVTTNYPNTDAAFLALTEMGYMPIKRLFWIRDDRNATASLHEEQDATRVVVKHRG